MGFQKTSVDLGEGSMFDEKVEKSILIGNGININFGGKAYSNQFILKRIIFNARAGKYCPLVNDIVSGEMIAIIFENFVSIANDIREGKYDAYISGEDVDILEDFKNRYNWRLAHYYEVGLEDWFFILHIYCLLYKELTENQKVLKQGFARMMLDSIYNDGDIQKLYMRMGRPVKKWLLEFDNVFTLNYDNNIEELTHKQVFHLHGDYRTLTHSLDPATLFGYIRKQKGERIEIPKGFKHCFCNALLDFAGDHKYKIALAFEKGEEGFLDLARRCVPEDALPGSISELLDAQSQHPELKFGVQYHFKEFRTLRGELHIIGMSPNNDSHIFKQIDESSIQKVVFYYYSDSEKRKLPIHQEVEYKSAKQLWKSLNVAPKKFNCKYPLPEKDKLSKILTISNSLSCDSISEEELVREVNSIPQFEIKRLCDMVDEELQRQKEEKSPQNIDEFLKYSREISRIALRYGILPSALFVHTFMNKKISVKK